METIQKYLPLLTVVGIAACVSHVTGIYRYAGEEWLSILSISDLIAQTWLVVPMLTIGLLAGHAHGTTLGPPGKSFAHVLNEQGVSPKRSVRWWAKTKAFVVYILGFGIIFAFVPLVRLLEPRYAVLSVGMAVAAGFCLFESVYAFTDDARRERAYIASALFLLLAFSYSVGVARGSIPFVSPPDDIVSIQNEDRCVNIISMTPQGILFTPDHDQVELVKWDDVGRVVRKANCANSPASGAG